MLSTHHPGSCELRQGHLPLEQMVTLIDCCVLVALRVNVIMHSLHLVCLKVDDLACINILHEKLVQLLPGQQVLWSEAA